MLQLFIEYPFLVSSLSSFSVLLLWMWNAMEIKQWNYWTYCYRVKALVTEGLPASTTLLTSGEHSKSGVCNMKWNEWIRRPVLRFCPPKKSWTTDIGDMFSLYLVCFWSMCNNEVSTLLTVRVSLSFYGQEWSTGKPYFFKSDKIISFHIFQNIMEQQFICK